MTRRFNYANDDNSEDLGFPLWCVQMGKSPFINRWALQEFALYIVEQYGEMYKSHGFSLSKSFKGCSRNLVMGNNALTIKQLKSNMPYKPSNLFTCKGRTCVSCGYKLALGDVAEVMRGIQEYAYSAAESEDASPEPIAGRSVIQICLTCSHSRDESLETVRKDNMRARSLFEMDRNVIGLLKEIGVDAECISNESPYGDNGWSFHPHMLFFCHTAVDTASLEESLTPIWQDKVYKVGRNAITGPCLSVDGGESVKTYLSKQAFELAYGNYGKDRGGFSHLRTPFHILYDCAEWYYWAVKEFGDESRAPAYEMWLNDVLVYLEWMDTMRGKRFFRWTPISRSVFPWLQSDEKKVEEYDQNGNTIIHILNGRIFWKSLSAAERFEIQRYGIYDDVEGLKSFVDQKGFAYIDGEKKEES